MNLNNINKHFNMNQKQTHQLKTHIKKKLKKQLTQFNKTKIDS